MNTPESYKDAYRNILDIRRKQSPRNWSADMKNAVRAVADAMVKNHEPPFFPLIVYIEPTNACNSNCIICPRTHMTRPVGYMKTELFKSIVNQVAGLGPSEIRLFNFGEPTLHPDLPAMIEYCLSSGLKASFQSNGIRLPPELVEQLLDAGLTYLGISINGLDAAEYAAIRPGHKQEVLESNLRRARKIATDKNKPLHIHINAQMLKTGFQKRRAETDEFAKRWLTIAESVSVSGISLYDKIMLVNNGRATETQINKLPRKNDAETACFEPFNRIIVKWDGRVTVCCADYDAKYVIGNLNSDTLEQAWNSEKMNDIREIIKSRRYSAHPLCRECPLFYSEGFSVVYKK